MTPEIQEFVESSQRSIAAMEAEHARLVHGIEKAESRVLRDILSELLSRYPEDIRRYVWDRARAEYGGALGERAGRWGEFDITMFATSMVESYCLHEISDLLLEAVGEECLSPPSPRAPLYVLPNSDREEDK